MRIRKTSQYIEGGASLSNVYGTSNENGYTQEYINELGTYSTDEVRVGTWANGKPVYRKLIYATCPNTNTNGTFVNSDIAIGSNNEISFIEWGYFVDEDSRIPINYSNNSGYMMKVFSSNPNTLRLFNSNTSWNGKDVVISLLFTKTTDTAQNTRSISNEEEPIEEEDNR